MIIDNSETNDVYVTERIDYLKMCEDIKTLIINNDVEADYESLSISGTVIVSDYLYPIAAGFDPGCGLATFETDIDLEEVKYKLTNTNTIPLNTKSILGIERRRYYFNSDVIDQKSALLGTIEKGNHFVELREHNKKIYIIIHSGINRNLKNEYIRCFINLFKKHMPNNMDTDNTYCLKIPADCEDAIKFIMLAKEMNRFAKANREYIGEMIAESLGASVLSKMDASHEFIEINENQQIIHCNGSQMFSPYKGKERALVLSGPKNSNYIVTKKNEQEFINHGSKLLYVSEDGSRKYSGFEGLFDVYEDSNEFINLEPFLSIKKRGNNYEYTFCE